MNPFKNNIRWLIAVLLFFATTINYIDRQVIGILKPYIQGELGWSEIDYGYIVSSFQFSYAIGLFFSGFLIDKIGIRIGYSIGISLWSLAGIGHAFMKSVFGFGVMRGLLGIGESANFPAAIKAVAEWFPNKERALATGWFNSGSAIGAIIGPIIVTYLGIRFGWQWAFIGTGSLGFIWLFFWLLLYKSPGNYKKLSEAEYNYIHQDSKEEDVSIRLSWKEMLKDKRIISLCTARFISDWAWWFFLFWTPSYLKDAFGLDLSEVKYPLIIIYTVASLGGISGGLISSAIIKREKSLLFARKKSLFVFASFVVPVVLCGFIKEFWVVIACISLAAAAHQGWAANVFTIVSDVFSKKSVASVTGLCSFAGALGGTIFSAAVGFIREWRGDYLIVFFMIPIVYFTAWLIVYFFYKPAKQSL